ncbi:MAG: deoxyribose-phosphate aldolase [Candidatus Sumerlaeaceae bacterium]|nr:deoxyribose-phosphate aldolase [Candidatus Sumerlaeaceae bacterium]
MNAEEISKIVDEVVARVASQLGAAAAPAPTASAKPEASCPADKDARTAASKEVLDKGACRVGVTDVKSIHCDDLAPYIDHTLLKPNATEQEIEKLCLEARQYKFASVCVNTSYVEQCARVLEGSGVKVCCVVGFPLGAMTSDAKAFETRDAIAHGAEEIDMVINVGKLQSGNFAYVYDDIRAVVRAAQGRIVKVILETSMLNEDEKICACALSKAAGADFVKTSTGFGGGGATAEDISLMRRIVGDQMGVKASGGIRDCTIAAKMVESGANRIGASASVNIVKGEAGKGGY